MTRGDGVPGYTMRQLAAFIAVAETGTISGAADTMHLSQSAVSAAVTDLERALGAQLCVRRRAHGISLTPTGEAVLGRARTLLQQATELQDDATGSTGTVVGPVAIGCYPALGPTLLPSMIAGFTSMYPRASVAFREETQNQLRGALESGQLDVAIVYDLDLPPTWRLEPLLRREPMVLLAADHPLAASGEPVALADLVAEPMILLDAPPSSNHALGLCRQAGFTPNVVYRTANFETARAFVGRGLGWTILLQRPHFDVTYEGRGVAPRPIRGGDVPAVSVVVAWPAKAVLSRVSRAFVTFARDLHRFG
ncbi:LysR family transcriptional regulator [Rhodococcus rhodnii]|uniref:LysR family transcriptional regulator n=2 Tax=Rhodococcus rhodnii TaxID=38312 RepID=R7WT85_9NOCA|nr:LysR substrate-binding domain-containing protein [Rhodococcus rhodnii]EOM77334.1 LysR family transcriptional regulator [Rhodococcus rhodnii LMG 5362]TXG91710.1 LysR family transcriptional regulator [Rhodococcus rhodnii]